MDNNKKKNKKNNNNNNNNNIVLLYVYLKINTCWLNDARFSFHSSRFWRRDCHCARISVEKFVGDRYRLSHISELVLHNFLIRLKCHAVTAVVPTYVSIKSENIHIILERRNIIYRSSYIIFFFQHNFCVKPYVPWEPRRDPSNRRLNEHGIYIRHCQESNSQPVLSQAGS